MVILPDPVTPVPHPQWRLTAVQKQEAEKVKAAAKIAEKAAKEEAKGLSTKQKQMQDNKKR